MNSTQEKAHLSFHEGILRLKFVENAVVEAEDVIYIHCYAFEQSKRKPYALLFDSSSKHELSEDAMTYLGESNYLDNLTAMAYISKDIISKIRLKLLLIFEKPSMPLKTFDNEFEAHMWLKQKVNYKADFPL
jgi:hypothetical protein